MGEGDRLTFYPLHVVYVSIRSRVGLHGWSWARLYLQWVNTCTPFDVARFSFHISLTMSSGCALYRRVYWYHIIVLNVSILFIFPKSLAVPFNSDGFNNNISSDIHPKIGTLSFFSKPRQKNFINITKEYLDEIMNLFGTNGTMNSHQFTQMIEEFKKRAHSNSHSAKRHSNGDELVTHDAKTTPHQLYNASETTFDNPQLNQVSNWFLTEVKVTHTTRFRCNKILNPETNPNKCVRILHLRLIFTPVALQIFLFGILLFLLYLGIIIFKNSFYLLTSV